MKIKFGLLCLMMLCGVIITNAQGGGGMRRTPEERSKRVVDTLTTLFKLDQDHQTQATTVFVDYYKSMTTLGQGASQEDRQKLTGDRDEKLKKVLGDDQFKKFKDDIEPAMRPRRPGGGGGGNN